MPNIRVFLTKEEIEKRVKEIAKKISQDYKSGVYIVCILKGAYVFCADLTRAISEMGGPQIEIDFLFAKSYNKTESTGDLRVEYFDAQVKDKDVLVVEDIVDTGLTIQQVRMILEKRGAKSVRICTLLDKPSRRQIKLKPEYVGFEMPNLYAVGYGLDLEEKYRELNYIGVIQ